jgi:hypothetical protein
MNSGVAGKGPAAVAGDHVTEGRGEVHRGPAQAGEHVVDGNNLAIQALIAAHVGHILTGNINLSFHGHA